MGDLTFQDKLRQRDQLLQVMAVWQEAHEHLAKFLDADASPTKLGIRSKGESLTVSQQIIMLVRSKIETEINTLDTEVGNINKAKVAEKNETNTEGKTTTKAESTTEAGAPQGKGRRRAAKKSNTSTG